MCNDEYFKDFNIYLKKIQKKTRNGIFIFYFKLIKNN